MTTYRLWPSTPSPSVAAPKANDVTFATEFTVNADQGLYGIWFYSAPGVLVLPSACVIWGVVSQAKVAGTENLTPTWSGIAGSGWVQCAYTGEIELVANTRYRVSVYHDASSLWRTNTAGYWTTGAGASGITNGPISAFSNATATVGQGITGVGYTFPNTGAAGQNFWVDAEVGDLVVPVPGSATVGNASADTTGTVSASSSVLTGIATTTLSIGSAASTATATNSVAASVTVGNAA
jgi:hypothetical protein